MGKFLNDARERLEQIEYHHEHSGTGGYDQAVVYWRELSNIYANAARSKSGQSDAPAILLLVEKSDTLMNEMKSRKENAPQDPRNKTANPGQEHLRRADVR